MIHVSTTHNGTALAVAAPARLAPLIGKMPGFKAERNTDRWVGPATFENLCALAKDLSNLEGWAPDEDVTELLREKLEQARWVEQLKASGDGLGLIYDERLYDYQNAGVAMLLEGKCLLGDDMGTGKTVMALTAMRQLGRNALVVAPNSMKHKWVEEAKTWWPEADGVVIHGTATERGEQFTAAAESAGNGVPVLVTVNWEAIRTMSRVHHYGSIKLTEKDVEPGPLNEIPWTVVCADEAHRAKDPKGKASRALWWLGKGVEYTWALTGTPVANTPRDLWSIGRFYNPDAYGTSLWDWHDRFVESIDTFHGIKDVGLNPVREAEFLKAFDASYIRRTKREVLDLPPKTGGFSEDSSPNIREVPLHKDQKTAYNKMVKDLIARINGGILVATDPLALLTRLSQIASALPVMDGDGDVVALSTPSNKVSALLDFVDDELPDDEALVVFAASRKLIELAGAELSKKGIEVVYITGTIDPAQRAANIDRFQGGSARVALCTMGAGSEGITLTRANTVVFLQRSYSFIQSMQAEGRVDRIGQENPVTLIDFVSPGTVDEDVVEALLSKGEMSEEVLRDRARTILERKA